MRLSRTSARTIAPALVLALATLTACGDDDSNTDDDTSTSASPTESEESTEQPGDEAGDEASDDSSEGGDDETGEDSDPAPGAIDPADSRLCKVITAKVVSDVFGAKASPSETRNGCGFMMLSEGASVTVAEGVPPAGRDLRAGFEQARKNAPGKAEDLPDFGEGAFISVKEGGGSTLATAMMLFGDGIAIFSASDTRPGVKEKIIELMELATNDGS